MYRFIIHITNVAILIQPPSILLHLFPPTRKRYRSVPASRSPSSTPAGYMPEGERKAGQDKRNTSVRAVTLPSKLSVRHPVRISSPDVCPGSPLLSYPFFPTVIFLFGALP